MNWLYLLVDKIPYKREIAAVLAFAVVVIQGWNSLAPELGHGPCLNNADQIADALKAVSTCAADWTLKIPDTVNAAIMALLGGGVAVGKVKDRAEILDQVKPGSQTAAFKKETA